MEQYGREHDSGSCARLARVGESAPIVISGEVTSPLSSEFCWPRTSEVVSSQKRVPKRRQPNGLQTKQGVLCLEDRCWIPTRGLQTRILIIGHCGQSGHRGTAPTQQLITSLYFWPGMQRDIAEFCRSCLVCLSTLGGERIPRPLGQAIHGTSQIRCCILITCTWAHLA